MLTMFFVKDLLKKYPLAVWFVMSFGLWLFAFRDFVFLHHRLTEDAVPYYQDISYFWRNLSMGVYPLWHPYFAEGSPNEFFLRRIGSFNPFLLLGMLFYTLGIPQFMSHTLFLSIYYFVGALGFYLTAKVIFGDKRMAFTAFLLLYFSALGTRLFDSYLVFPTIPMIWFFYFLCAFAQQPQRRHCLGMLFCLMIIFTTYIPFYFVTILWTFLFCYAAVYAHTLKEIWSKVKVFIFKNKLFLLLCCAIFAVSLLPGIMLYRDANQGGFVMPVRNSAVGVKSAVEVDRHWVEWWAILEDLFFSFNFLRDIREYDPAIFYIPIFGLIAFLSSLIVPTNRRLVLLFSWGLLMFLIGTPHTPVNQFLSSNIFYFKYFRNLHFFLWMQILPVAILIITEQLRSLLAWLDSRPKKRLLLLAFIMFVHAAVLLCLFLEKHEAVSSYIIVASSGVFFALYASASRKVWGNVFATVILGLIVAEPIEVYNYLRKNVELHPDYLSESSDYYQFQYFEGDTAAKTKEAYERVGKVYMPAVLGSGLKTIYYGLPWYGFLYANVDSNAYEAYVNHSIYFYDKVKKVDDKNIDMTELNRNFYAWANEAFVSDYAGPLSFGDAKTFSAQAQPFVADRPDFKVVRFNANELVLRSGLNVPKFVVYNDNYDKRWHGFMDGKPMPIYRANVSFKGFWVPAGEHTIHLRYETISKYVFNYAMMVVFWGVFISMLCSNFRQPIKPEGA